MAERKPIPKKIRFEVLKRDKFTCQYCGKSAPDVVLEIDHIKPVSKGGDNDILNLVTSCADCNRGKSNVELSDDSAIKKQQRQIQELAERKEQLEMMLEWRSGLHDLENDYVNAVADVFDKRTRWGVSDHGKTIIKKWLKNFSLNEVLDACDVAINSYYDGTENSWNKAFDKVSGICANKKKYGDGKQSYYINYVLKVARSNFTYVDQVKVRKYISENIFDDDDFEKLKMILFSSKNWTKFREELGI